jgi:putative transposase
MDERYLRSAARYTLRNPVRDGLAEHAGHWQHSSASAHLSGQSDGTVDVGPLAERIPDWESFLGRRTEPSETRVLITQARCGLPAGSKDFVASLEARFEKRLTRLPVGRPPKKRQG